MLAALIAAMLALNELFAKVLVRPELAVVVKPAATGCWTKLDGLASVTFWSLLLENGIGGKGGGQ